MSFNQTASGSGPLNPPAPAPVPDPLAPSVSPPGPAANGGRKIAQMEVSRKRQILPNQSTNRSRKYREKKRLALDHAKKSQANVSLTEQDIEVLNTHENDKRKRKEYQQNYRARMREAEDDDDRPSIHSERLQSTLVYPAVPLAECPSLQWLPQMHSARQSEPEPVEQVPISSMVQEINLLRSQLTAAANQKANLIREREDKIRSRITAENQQAIMVRDEEINLLRSQLTAANQQANLVREREDEINRLKLQVTAANQQAYVVREREDEIKQLLAAANEQATLVREQEQEIKGLKTQLTTSEQMASLNRKREEELKKRLEDYAPAIARKKKEVKDLRSQLKNENGKLREAREIFKRTDIECALCLDVMWHPMCLTGCMHSFCDDCLIRAGRLSCPICRERIVEQPREDKPLRSLIEKVAFFLDGSKPRNATTIPSARL